jgi:hypothetical protein
MREILTAYRTQVEAAWSAATAHEDYPGTAGSPVGQCGVTSAWLQQRLTEDHGIRATYCTGAVFGRTGGCLDAHHCWLEIGTAGDPDRLVLDLTADQFGLDPVVYATWNLLAWRDRVFYEARTRDRETPQPRLALLTGALT